MESILKKMNPLKRVRRAHKSISAVENRRNFIFCRFPPILTNMHFRKIGGNTTFFVFPPIFGFKKRVRKQRTLLSVRQQRSRKDELQQRRIENSEKRSSGVSAALRKGSIYAKSESRAARSLGRGASNDISFPVTGCSTCRNTE